MSRAGLTVQVLADMEEFLKKLRQREELSRAALRRQLHRFAGITLENANEEDG